MISIERPDCPEPDKLAENYKHAVNKAALVEASHGKCMYCESKISHVYYGDIEHIKPKAAGKYPHLAFEWTNLGFSCAICNNTKKDRYDPGCPPIDPYSEDPSRHLLPFGTMMRHRAGSERGEVTILLTGLNRVELVERRAMTLRSLQSAIDACFRSNSPVIKETLLDALRQEGLADKEYSLFTSALLSANLEN